MSEWVNECHPSQLWIYIYECLFDISTGIFIRCFKLKISKNTSSFSLSQNVFFLSTSYQEMRAPHTVVKAKNVQVSQREMLSNTLIQSSSTPCPPPKCSTYPFTCLHSCYNHSSPSLQHSFTWSPHLHSCPHSIWGDLLKI